MILLYNLIEINHHKVPLLPWAFERFLKSVWTLLNFNQKRARLFRSRHGHLSMDWWNAGVLVRIDILWQTARDCFLACALFTFSTSFFPTKISLTIWTSCHQDQQKIGAKHKQTSASDSSISSNSVKESKAGIQRNTANRSTSKSNSSAIKQSSHISRRVWVDPRPTETAPRLFAVTNEHQVSGGWCWQGVAFVGVRLCALLRPVQNVVMMDLL